MYKTICKLMDGDSRLRYMDKKSENIWITHCYETLDEAIGYIKRHIKSDIIAGMYFNSKVSDKSNYHIDGIVIANLLQNQYLFQSKLKVTDFSQPALQLITLMPITISSL